MGRVRTENSGGAGKTIKPAAAAAIIAGIIGASSIGVCAATGIIPVADAFKNVYEIDSGMSDTAESMGKAIGDSVVSGNIRMTADAVIGDGRHVAVVSTLEKTDGTDFDEEMFYNESDDELQIFFRDEDWDLDADFTDSVNVGGTSYFLKMKDGKKSIQFVDNAYANQNVIGGRFRRTFKDIGIYEGESDDVKILERGRWSFDIPLEYEDKSITYMIDTELSKEGEPVYVESLMISPIGYELSYNAYELLPAYILMKDGTQVDMLQDNYYTAGEVSKSMRYIFSNTFNRMIDPYDIEAVKIGDTEFRLSEMGQFNGDKEQLDEYSNKKQDEIFTQPNKGMFCVEYLYEGKEELASIDTAVYSEDGEQISANFVSDVGGRYKKGTIVHQGLWRDDIESKYGGNAKKEEKLSLSEVTFKTELWLNEEDHAEVELDDFIKEFGKIYTVKITGNAADGYRAEYQGERDLTPEYLSTGI